jgi:acyl-CoA synthetase (AMP-forming)/AMP-acid ligase II
MNLMDLLDMAVAGYPDRVALGRRGQLELTYSDILQRAFAGAACVRAAGATRLVYVAPNGPGFPIALFAAAAAGVPLAPINYRLSESQLTGMLQQQQPALTIADGDAATIASSCSPLVLTPREWLTISSQPGDVPAPMWDEEGDTAAVLLYTSGTTAEPKLAVLRHRHLTAYIVSAVDFASAEPDEAALLSVPPYHIAGIANVLSNIYAGRRLVPLESFSPSTWLATAREEMVTHAMIVPTMLARIVDEAETTFPADRGIPSLQTLAYGGAHVSPSVLERALRLFPAVGFVNAYGLTETSSTIAVLGPEDHRTALSTSDPVLRARLKSVGQPVPGVEIQIRGDDGVELQPGASGDIWVRGEQVSGEYLGHGASLDDDGWLITRDRGFLDGGGYLFVEGRVDDTIIRGGENVAPSEIEDVINRHPSVQESVVVGVHDPEWGQRIVAVVIPREGLSVTVDEIRGWVRSALRSSKTPDRVEFWHSLPHTETGKLLRRQVAAALD